ncbi:hypothetical protein AMTRI_Chr03g148130 [Amborella trichopoda]
MILADVCLMCKEAEETTNHIFIHCACADRLWDWLAISECLQQIWTPPSSSLGLSMWKIVAAVFFWKERNFRTFKSQIRDFPKFVIAIKSNYFVDLRSQRTLIHPFYGDCFVQGTP